MSGDAGRYRCGRDNNQSTGNGEASHALIDRLWLEQDGDWLGLEAGCNDTRIQCGSNHRTQTERRRIECVVLVYYSHAAIVKR